MSTSMKISANRARSPRWLGGLALCLCLALAATPAVAEVTALRGATVHPVSGPAIADGVVLIEGDTIQAVGGPDTAIPAGATVVDLAGRHIYPGFLYSNSKLGLIEIGSVRGTDDTRELEGNNAHHRAEVAVSADSLRLPPAMAGGITSAHVVPGGGRFTGTSAVMRLHGWNWEAMTVRAGVGMHLNFPDVSAGDDASTGELGDLGDLLDEARRYDVARKASGAPQADLDVRLEALRPVLAGEQPLFIHADGRQRVGAALDWADEQGFENVVLVSNFRVAELAERLAEAEVPVILRTVWGLPRSDSDAYDVAFTAPARLHEAGVRFAISDPGDAFSSSNARNLPFEAAQAATFGLPRDVALASITLTAADILGVGDRLGSLEAGKEASLFVSDGDPLEILTNIERVWVAGQEIDLEADHQWRLYDKYRSRPKSGK